MNSTQPTSTAESLVGKAILAPSSHNTQPWRFRVSDSAIDLFADRTRALPVNDPDDRELTISCGCALMNLRIAAAEAGWPSKLELFPDRTHPDWLARLSADSGLSPEADEAALAPYIAQRRTYRKPFLSREVPANIVTQLREAAEQSGARLRTIKTEDERMKVASLVAEANAAQWADPDWRRELAAWMHPRSRGDGLTVSALAAPIVPLVVRRFDMGKKIGARDAELVVTAPVLAVLETDDDQPADWLQAGQALQHLLLLACEQGLQASYLNQPVQVAAARPKLKSLFGGGFPQILMRLGYPREEIPAAPRRDIAEVMERS